MVIRMKETPISGFQDFINWFIEYFLFYRWIFFKNRPRVNFLLLRSLMIVGTWFLLYYFFFSSIELLIVGIDVDPVIILGLCVVFGFWGMSHTFAQKSVDCLHLYNDYLKEFASGDLKVANLLATSLSLQLLMVDLYAHRNFTWLFAKTLKEAIGDDEVNIKKFDEGQMSVREARFILQDHLKSLMQG